MGRVDGKVAFITGAARGQGRSHALRLAEEGADIIAIDVCDAIPTNAITPATEADLEETVRQVEALDRRIVATKADIRDFDAVKTAVDAGVAELGRLDIVAANAAIFGTPGRAMDISETDWHTMIDVNLSGAWHTVKATVPHLRTAGGGSIIITSSDLGLFAFPNMSHYISAKHGLVGLMRAFALELAEEWIRVNTVHPTLVATDMALNDTMYRLCRPDLENPTHDDFVGAATLINALPLPYVDPADISNAVLWLASDEARYVTGVTLPVDAGANLK